MRTSDGKGNFQLAHFGSFWHTHRKGWALIQSTPTLALDGRHVSEERCVAMVWGISLGLLLGGFLCGYLLGRKRSKDGFNDKEKPRRRSESNFTDRDAILELEQRLNQEGTLRLARQVTGGSPPRSPRLDRARNHSHSRLREDTMSIASSNDDAGKIYGLGGYSQSNRVLLCMVGLPARGKSYITKMLMRYLTWSGFPVKAFNAGNVRRQTGNCSASAEFFSSAESATKMREQIADECMHEAIAWLRMHKSVCVAIFDATNTTTRRRQRIIDKCRQVTGITPVFVESICENKEILERNYTLKLANDDYRNMDPTKARLDFIRRVEEYKSRYQTVTDSEDEGEICYVKLYNVGQKVEMHHCSGYLMSQIGFFLSNIHIQPRCIWLTRHAESGDQLSGILGSHRGELTHNGRNYCRELASFLHKCRREMEEAGHVESCGDFLVLMGTAPVHYSTLQSMIKSSSSNLSDGDPSPASISVGIERRPGLMSMLAFLCCTEYKRDDFAVLEVNPAGVVKASSALQKGRSMHDLDEMNYYTITLILSCQAAVLMRDADGNLDLSLEKSDPEYAMIKSLTKPVLEWNRSNPHSQVLEFDRIVAVNRQRGTGLELIRCLQVPIANQRVMVMLQRPVERKLVLKRPGKLGLTVNLMPKDSVKPWIDKIAEGLLRDSNEANPEKRVREHDRVMCVNGVSDPPASVALQLSKETDMDLTVLHYLSDGASSPPAVPVNCKGFQAMSTSLLNELDGGVCNGLSYAEIIRDYPDLWAARERDKLNFRYPNGESYQDVIGRLRPIIIELERQRRSILVISHLAVQRCLYAYFTGAPMEEIPYLKMDMHTVVELRPGAFDCQVRSEKLWDTSECPTPLR
eukprot:s2719_g9.t2